MDALNIMMSFNVINNGNVETAYVLLQKCVVLIESKYEAIFFIFYKFNYLIYEESYTIRS